MGIERVILGCGNFGGIGSDLSLVRTCEGTGCILFFYDTTKSHTRRWCSMAGCGNRMKATLFYQRGRGNQKS